MADSNILAWILLGFLLLSVGGNIGLGIYSGILNEKISDLESRDCVEKSEFDRALQEAGNETIYIQELYDQSQLDLGECNEDLSKEKAEVTSLTITINNVWTFVIGVSFTAIIWIILKLLWIAINSENNKKNKK